MSNKIEKLREDFDKDGRHVVRPKKFWKTAFLEFRAYYITDYII